MPSLAELLSYNLGGGQRGTLAELGSQPLDLQSKRLRRGPFAPAIFASMMQQSPAMQEWAQPEDLAATQGVEQAQAGQMEMRTRARENAAMMGLGRGFTSQADLAAQQAALNEVSGALLASRLLGTERRAMMEQMLMEALTGGSQAAMLQHAQHRARQPGTAAEAAMTMSGIGNLAGGLGSLFGAFTGAGGGR